MPRSTRTILASLPHTVHAIIARSPGALRNLADLYDNAASPGASDGTGCRSKNSISDPTGTTAMAGTDYWRRHQQITHGLEQLDRLAEHLLTIINADSPVYVEAKTLRCTGGKSEQGAIEWGRPDCENIAAPSRSGLCDACYKRKQRWSRERVSA